MWSGYLVFSFIAIFVFKEIQIGNLVYRFFIFRTNHDHFRNSIRKFINLKKWTMAKLEFYQLFGCNPDFISRIFEQKLINYCNSRSNFNGFIKMVLISLIKGLLSYFDFLPGNLKWEFYL